MACASSGDRKPSGPGLPGWLPDAADPLPTASRRPVRGLLRARGTDRERGLARQSFPGLPVRFRISYVTHNLQKMPRAVARELISDSVVTFDRASRPHLVSPPYSVVVAYEPLGVRLVTPVVAGHVWLSGHVGMRVARLPP